MEQACVLVRLGGERYALPLDRVAEVVPVPTVTRVPGTPEWLAGVVNWRGRVLALVDLRHLLDLPRLAVPSSGRVVVLHVDGLEVGVVVESVVGIVRVDAAALAAPPATMTDQAAAIVAGVTHDPAHPAAGPLAVVDAKAVADLRARLHRSRRSA